MGCISLRGQGSFNQGLAQDATEAEGMSLYTSFGKKTMCFSTVILFIFIVILKPSLKNMIFVALSGIREPGVLQQAVMPPQDMQIRQLDLPMLR